MINQLFANSNRNDLLLSSQFRDAADVVTVEQAPMSFRVYYRPGCSSCAKTKELLSLWGIPFEAIDVEGNEAAFAELARRGLRLVPVVTEGERQFHGWNPEALARFVGADTAAHESSLPRSELIGRLNRILLAAQRAIMEVPVAALDQRIPGRERTIRDLTYHLFRLCLAYRDAFETGFFPAAWLLETAPPQTQDAPSLARYGEFVRQSLVAWLDSDDAPARVVETYYGPQCAEALLERTVWHAAQHLRQLYALMQSAHVLTTDPLTQDDFAGLPLPKSLW